MLTWDGGISVSLFLVSVLSFLCHSYTNDHIFLFGDKIDLALELFHFYSLSCPFGFFNSFVLRPEVLAKPPVSSLFSCSPKIMPEMYCKMHPILMSEFISVLLNGY